MLGNEYYAVGMPAEDQHSQLGVVAVEGGSTEITVTLPDTPGLQVLVSVHTLRFEFLVNGEHFALATAQNLKNILCLML